MTHFRSKSVDAGVLSQCGVDVSVCGVLRGVRIYVFSMWCSLGHEYNGQITELYGVLIARCVPHIWGVYVITIG